MTVLKEWDLHALLVKGEHQAQKRGERVLVTQVTKIAPIDPLSFFAAGLKQYKGSRIYWTDPDKGTILVGLGTAFNIEAHGGDRFRKVERAWETLCRAHVLDTERTTEKTGPLLFGGFSFDPETPKSSLWSAFPDAGFVLPTFLLTVTDGAYWLTVNRIVEPGDQVEDEAQVLSEKQQDMIRKAKRDAVLREADTQANAYIESVVDVKPDHWKRTVKDTAQEIRDGLMDKVVLARELRVKLSEPVNVPHVIRGLCQQQPNSFVFAVERGDQCFLGASPERLVKRDGRQLFSVCLAGSIARGRTAAEDTRLGKKLLRDEKNRREHEVVVEMIKHAMQTGCDELAIPDEPSLYKVRDMQHLYTPVVGQARTDATLLSLVQKLHPTPALGGFPQGSAMQKIREKEELDRGWYAGPIGWMDGSGNGEFAVAIRSGLIQKQTASLFAGCGIVGRSEPQAEFVETRLKFRPMLSALGGTEG